LPSRSVMTAPEYCALTADCDRTEAIDRPSGSSFAISLNGSIQPFIVVNFPGSCSNGQVRVHTSKDPVGLPNENGATRRDNTVVRGTDNPIASAISSPNALSPTCRLKLFGQAKLAVAGRLSDDSYSHIRVWVFLQPRGFG